MNEEDKVAIEAGYTVVDSGFEFKKVITEHLHIFVDTGSGAGWRLMIKESVGGFYLNHKIISSKMEFEDAINGGTAIKELADIILEGMK